MKIEELLPLNAYTFALIVLLIIVSFKKTQGRIIGLATNSEEIRCGNTRKFNFRKCIAMFCVSVVVYLYQNKKSLKLLINKLFIIFMLENLLTVVNCICLLGAVIRLC